MVEHTRTLGFTVAFAIGLGTMIAAGIFSLSGTAVAAVGSSAVVSFVIAAVVASLTAAAYSEFASVYTENGGGYLFSSRTFEDDRLVYAIGAMLFLGYTGTTAFYLATMDEWLFRFVLPPPLDALPHGTTGVLAAVLLGALNARGTEESGTFQVLVTGAKVAVLLAFVAGALAFRGPGAAVGTFAANVSTDAVSIVAVAALAFITFFGFSAIAASAGEIIEPRRTVPLAIAASIVSVTVLYVLVIVAMVNSPVPPEVVAAEGETAMGRVAAGFLGSAGRSLVVAGAVFSMVSASNASVLAAGGIGSLMGRQGQAPRRFGRLHRRYNTPFWSLAAATAVVVALIALFVGAFPADGGPAGVALGLTQLTGFATFNLLLPLAVVNVALVYSRRRYPDVERGFRVPGVPVVPALGVVANLALVYNLPVRGTVAALGVDAALVAAYLAWGGAPAVEDLVERVVPSSPAGPAGGGAETGANGGDADRHRTLVAVAQPSRAARYVKLAALLGRLRTDDPLVQVVNVTHIPEQTPNEAVRDAARERARHIEDLLSAADVDVEYTVEGHVCRDVAFDIVHTAREDGADEVLMGYPEEHPHIAERVEYDSPCPVLFASGFTDPTDVSVVTVGAGGGPHHRALLPLVDAMGRAGATVHVVGVDPQGGGGRAERVEETVAALRGVESIRVHNVVAPSVAEGLVDAARTHGGVLLLGATRTRRLRRWVFGSTPDRVIELAADHDVPVLVYAGPRGVRGPVEDLLYPIYRSLTGRRTRQPVGDGATAE